MGFYCLKWVAQEFLENFQMSVKKIKGKAEKNEEEEK
jgi:hypothetical protein